MWSALPPYLGGKRRLCPTIFRELDKILPRRNWPGLTFLDRFLGGGSVALYAKAQGFRVEACDIAERAIVVGHALVENQRVKLTREDVLKLASPPRSPAGPAAASCAKSRVYLLVLAHPCSPRRAKALLGVALAYLALPFDLISGRQSSNPPRFC